MHEIDLRKPRGIFLKILNTLSLITGSVLIWEWYQLDYIIFLFIGLAFLISYTLYIGNLHRLKYNKEKNSITHRKGIFIPFYFKIIDADKVKKVELRSETTKTKKGVKTIYQLVLTGEKDYILTTGDPLFIRRKGEEVSSELRLSLTNEMFAKPTTRRFSELNTPLLEQWKKKKYTPKKPLVKRLKALDYDENEKRALVIIPSERLSLKLSGIILGAIVVIALAFYPILGEYTLLYFAFFGSTLVLVAAGLTVLATPSRLIVNDESVIYREGYFLVSNSIKIIQIEEIISHADELVIIGDHKYLLIKPKMDEETFKTLKDLLDYQLYKRGKKSLKQLTA